MALLERRGTGIDGLIDSLYETVTVPTDDCMWCKVLPTLCSLFDAAGANFTAHDMTGQGEMHQHFVVESGPLAICNDRILIRRPWACSRALKHEGAVAIVEAAMPADDLVRPELTGAFCHQLYGVVTREAERACVLTLLRASDAPPFDRRQESDLARILPHLNRAGGIRTEMRRNQADCKAFAEILDHLPMSFLTLSSTGRVLFRNRAATRMLASGNGLRMKAGHIVRGSETDTEELRELIRDIAHMAAPGGAMDIEHQFLISRGQARTPLVCIMYSLSCFRSDQKKNESTAVAMIVKDPTESGFSGIANFIRAYRLTKAEARLVGLLTDGHGLVDAARTLGVTKNTARTHMRRIYSKVGANRQADLVQLCSRFGMF